MTPLSAVSAGFEPLIARCLIHSIQLRPFVSIADSGHRCRVYSECVAGSPYSAAQNAVCFVTDPQEDLVIGNAYNSVKNIWW